MIKGLYTAASAMNLLEKKSDITANNLANTDTDGFKRQDTVSASFPEMLLNRIDSEGAQTLNSISTGAFLDHSFRDNSQGHLKATGNKLDLAVQGDGYFMLETEAGIRYSRNGNFSLNSSSEIVNQNGQALLDTNGQRIQLIDGEDFIISANGEITFNNGLEGSQIALMSFADQDQLISEGNNLFQLPEEAEAPQQSEAVIVQGHLENSNVEIVKEMVNMIKTTRQYESNQKVIQSIDDNLNMAINELGQA